MPQLTFCGRTVELKRLSLDVHDIAGVLDEPENEIRNMFRRGELSNVSHDRKRRADPAQVADILEQRIDVGALPHTAASKFARLLRTPR